MTYDSNCKQIQHSEKRGLWPLLAAFWMAVGFSPCVLAMTGDCLHCPSEAATEGHGSHGTHTGHGEQSHAEHAASGHGDTGGDCGDDCLDADESLVDARGVKTASKDVGDNPVVAGALPETVELAAPFPVAAADPPPDLRVPRERLHALNCVYLD